MVTDNINITLQIRAKNSYRLSHWLLESSSFPSQRNAEHCRRRQTRRRQRRPSLSAEGYSRSRRDTAYRRPRSDLRQWEPLDRLLPTVLRRSADTCRVERSSRRLNDTSICRRRRTTRHRWPRTEPTRYDLQMTSTTYHETAKICH